MIRLIDFLFKIVTNNILITIIFSLTWIAIYFLLRFSRFLSQLVFLRFNTLRFKFWRTHFSFDKLIEKFRSGETIQPKKAELFSKNIAAKISSIDRELSSLVLHRNCANIFFDKNTLKILTNEIAEKNLIFLEKDHAFFMCFSGNEEIMEKGMLNFINNPLANQPDIKSLLFFLLETGQKRIGSHALFHIKSRITRKSEMDKLTVIVSSWPKSIRNDGEKTIKELKSKFLKDSKK